ncbi:MAG: PAS domain-containing protein, partial [Armatimonadota bacterium]
MNLRRHAVPAALAAGALAWLLDALIAHLLLDGGTFVDCLILDLSAGDWVRRIGLLLLFTVFGAVLSEAPAEEEVEDDELGDLLDFGQFTYEAQVMMLGLDPDGRITLFNRRCEQVTGYAADEVLGVDFFDEMVPARALPDVLPAFKAVLSGAQTVRRETPWLTKPGEEVIVSFHLSPVHDDTGDVVGVVIVGEEVTEYRLTDAELLLSREPWRPLAESVMGDGMAAVDADGTVTWASQSLAEILREDRDALIGTRLAELVADHDAERLSSALASTVGEREPINEEFCAAPRVGGQFPVQVALQPVGETEEEAIGAFVIVRDLTEMKRGELEAGAIRQDAETQLERLRRQVEDAERRIEEVRQSSREETEARLAELTEQLEAAEAQVEQAREDA